MLAFNEIFVFHFHLSLLTLRGIYAHVSGLQNIHQNQDNLKSLNIPSPND